MEGDFVAWVHKKITGSSDFDQIAESYKSFRARPADSEAIQCLSQCPDTAAVRAAAARDFRAGIAGSNNRSLRAGRSCASRPEDGMLLELQRIAQTPVPGGVDI